MFCPLLKDSYGSPKRCTRRQCAFFVVEKKTEDPDDPLNTYVEGRCIVHQIAASLNTLANKK